MRVENLGVGVESVSLWQVEDEVHLPKEGGLAPTFLPQYRPLDDILRRPSLDERLPRLLQPEMLDPDLLTRTLSDTHIAAGRCTPTPPIARPAGDAPCWRRRPPISTMRCRWTTRFGDRCRCC